jgi:uncharacterized membrane protein HdeD (DUF308 family)
MLAVQGAFALLFGVLALLMPGVTLIVLVALFAAWAFIGGFSSIVAAIQHRQMDRAWWLVLLLGVVSVVAGAIAIFNPGITIFVLVLIMGANALVNGVLMFVMAIKLRKTIEREWLLILTGVVSVIFGVLVLLFPLAGALTMVYLVSFYAIITGFMLLTLAFRARKWRSRRTSSASGAQPDTGPVPMR